MNTFDYDLVVVGGGSGGVRAARIAANHGARVAIAEEFRWGGTCVIRGCVPKKLLVMASEFARHAVDSRGFGWLPQAMQHDWSLLREAKEREITRLEGIYRSLLQGAGATVFEARATLLAPHVVDIGGRQVTAKHILIATGAAPQSPAISGAEHLINSNQAFDLPALPRRIVVLGGGYIACEFAGIFNGLGAQVTQVHRGDLLLRGFDGDVRQHLTREIAKTGIRLALNVEPTGVSVGSDATGSCLHVHLNNGNVLQADTVLAATGRRPNTQGLGLEALGVATTASGALIVDKHARTNVPDIFAVGDCTTGPQLTPVAIRQGHAFADTVFGGQARTVDLRFIATAVFSQPQVATVGLSEEQARYAAPGPSAAALRIYMTTFKPMKATLSGRDERTLMKLVVDDTSDRILGAHMVGPDAAEIMQGLAIALQAGATKAHFDATIGIHPTAAEEFVTLRQPVR